MKFMHVETVIVFHFGLNCSSWKAFNLDWMWSEYWATKITCEYSHFTVLLKLLSTIRSNDYATATSTTVHATDFFREGERKVCAEPFEA